MIYNYISMEISNTYTFKSKCFKEKFSYPWHDQMSKKNKINKYIDFVQQFTK